MPILETIAYARSGDKGAHGNIGVIAYKAADYQLLLETLTRERVKQFLSDLPITEVIRYELPNLWALNFLLKNALGEGGSRSLRMDAQGKGLGQRLLQMPLFQSR